MKGGTSEMKKRVLCLFFALLLICLSFASTSVYAASPSFVMTDVEDVGAEEEVRVSIRLKDSNISVGAFSFSLTYDATKLRYVSGSFDSTYFDDVSVYTKDGKLNFAWDSTKNISVKTGVVFNINFVTSSDFVDDTVVEMTKGNVYRISKDSQGNLSFEDVYVKEQATVVSATISSKSNANVDESVNNVIQKIDSLPDTVVATEDYKKALNDALNAYANLTYAQQKKVTNYDKLVEKNNEYLGITNNLTSDEAKAWLNNQEWKYTFELTASTVKLADKEQVEKALAAWEKLSAGARYETMKERLFLKSLVAIIDDVYAEDIKKQEQEALLQEAMGYVEAYKKEWQNVLKLKLEEIVGGHLDPIKQAESALNNLQGLGAYDLAYNILITDGTYAHLQALKEKALEAYAKENPEDAEFILLAEKFRSQFGYVLGLDVKDVTYDDVADITTAYITYDFLDEKTKSYLKTEYAKLEELMAACDNVYPDEDDTAEGDEESSTVKEVIKWLSGSDNYDITFKTRGISQFIRIFLILDAVALILFAGTKVMFWIVKRKYKKYRNQEVQ